MPPHRPEETRALKGYLAICSRGTKGFILEEFPKKITYPDGSVEHAWVGVHLGPSRVGKAWSSRRPRVLRKLSPSQSRMIVYMVNRARALNWQPPLVF